MTGNYGKFQQDKVCKMKSKKIHEIFFSGMKIWKDIYTTGDGDK